MSRVYKLKIEGPYGPENLPMARLARYMADLAALLGAPKHVHFVALEEGSATLTVEVETAAAPKVDARLAAIKQGEPSGSLRRAYDSLNRHLADDKASARLEAEGHKKPRSAALEFPGQMDSGSGKEAAAADGEQAFINFRWPTERETLTGYLAEIRSPQRAPRLTLEDRDRVYKCIRTTQKNAEKIAKYLYRPVRLHGPGDWLRDEQGEWQLKGFRMDRFEVLKDTPLDELTEQLRAIKGSEWPSVKDPDAVLREIRYGPDAGAQ